FTAINDRVWQPAQAARNPRRYWDWPPRIEAGRQVAFCATPPTAHFYGLEFARDLPAAEGPADVCARHQRLAAAPRACAGRWGQGGGPEIFSLAPAAASDSLTAVRVPDGHDADQVRAIANDKYGVALGRGLGALQGRVFRIGHMG